MAAPAPLAPIRRPTLLPASRAARWGLVAVAWGLAMTALSLIQAERATPPANRPIQTPAADYITADTCRACHPGNHASWHASYHRTMTQVAKPEHLADDIDGLEVNYDGLDYRVHRKGDAFFVRTKPTAAPASAFGPPQEIVLSTGSHNLQILWLAAGEGRTLAQFPSGYLVAENKWVPMEMTFLAPPGPKQVYDRGDWNNGCINCHTTHGRARPEGNGVFDSRVADFGIACEACHSGGKEHVERNRNPLRRFALHLTGAPDTTIANPARMDGPTSSLVCGSCHSIWAFKNPNDTSRFDREGDRFRPGMKELDERWVFQPHGTDHPDERAALLETSPHPFGDSFWGDGQVRVTGRELNGTQASPCFKGGKFSCLSCHEMHPERTDAASLQAWRPDQMAPGMDANRACLQCHQQYADTTKLTAHTRHAPASTGSSCYNCHMPHTTYGLLRAIRSHTITSPTVRESVEVGRPNACNLCHLDKSLAWTGEKLTEWYGQAPVALTREDHELAASVQWLLKGDAGQRALIAWSMGWQPAQFASGYEWMYPHLIFTLNDTYAAVRFAADKSLQTLPGFAEHDYDYTADDTHQKAAVAKAYQRWWFEVRNKREPFRPEVLLAPDGQFRQQQLEQLLDQRSTRRMMLVE